MPITKAAKKALRGSIRKAIRNKRSRKIYKASVKGFTENPKSEDLNKVISNIDKAKKKKIIHKKKASRLKSKVSKLLNKSKKS